jgi:hypothetical protein
MEFDAFACAKSMKGLSAVTDDELRGDRGRHGARAD